MAAACRLAESGQHIAKLRQLVGMLARQDREHREAVELSTTLQDIHLAQLVHRDRLRTERDRDPPGCWSSHKVRQCNRATLRLRPVDDGNTRLAYYGIPVPE